MLDVQMGDGNGDVGKGSFAIGRLWQFVGAQALTLTVSKARPQTLAVIMDMVLSLAITVCRY